MKLLVRTLAVLLALVGGMTLFGPLHTWFEWNRPLVWLTTAGVLGAAWCISRAGWVEVMARAVSERPGYAALLGTVIGGLVAALVQPLTTVEFGWDAGHVYRAAEHLASGSPAPIEDLSYFAQYPNNIPILAVQQLLMQGTSAMGADALGTLYALQVLSVTVVIGAVGATVGLLGRPGTVWLAQALTTVLLGLNPNMGVPYSDIPAAACVAAAVFLATLAWVRGHRWGWPAAFALLSLGVALKAYVVALPLGILLVMVLTWRRWGAAWVIATSAALTLGLGVTVVGIHAASAQVTGMTSERLADLGPPFPPEHFLAMGTFDSPDPHPTRPYGGYSPQHAEATLSERDPDRRQEMLREMIAHQVGGRTVLENLTFFGAKIAWFWGDGTFYAHGEGPDKEHPGLLPAPANDVQQWFIGHGEPYRAITANVLQGVWVSTLFLAAIGSWAVRPQISIPVGMASATLLIVTAYLTLFEARSRYLLALLPVLLVLTALVARVPRRHYD